MGEKDAKKDQPAKGETGKDEKGAKGGDKKKDVGGKAKKEEPVIPPTPKEG
jgi:hypothetical protein